MTLVGSSVLLAQNMPAPAPGPGMRDRGDREARVKARCEDRYARETGRIAYVETRLNLTEAQRPLFGRWKDVQLTIAKRHAAECGQLATRVNDERPARPGPVERMDRQETMLKQRVADLDAEKPAFAALYNALSPDQRTSLSQRHGGFDPGTANGQGRGIEQGPRGRTGGNLRPPPPPPPQ
jgi:hypothetical protein